MTTPSMKASSPLITVLCRLDVLLRSTSDVKEEHLNGRDLNPTKSSKISTLLYGHEVRFWRNTDTRPEQDNEEYRIRVCPGVPVGFKISCKGPSVKVVVTS